MLLSFTKDNFQLTPTPVLFQLVGELSLSDHLGEIWNFYLVWLEAAFP